MGSQGQLAQGRARTRYGAAIAAVMAAAVGRVALEPFLSGRGYYLFFLVAVLVVAVFGGRTPALLSAVLSVFVVHAFGWAPSGWLSLDLVAFGIAAASSIAIVGYVIALRDRANAGQHRAEWRADRANELAGELNLLLDATSGYAISMLDSHGNITIWSKAAERLSGWSESEVLGSHCRIFYPEAAITAGKPEADLAHALVLGRHEEEDWRVRRDGSEFLALSTTTALYDNNGDLKGFGKVVRDVTAQRAADQKLAASESHFRSILETVPDAMIVFDQVGDIISFSSAAERLFGYGEAEIVGSNISRLLPSPESEDDRLDLERFLVKGELLTPGIGRVVTGLRRDGATVPIELSVGETMSGGTRLFTAFIRDLTERLAAEQRIEELRSNLVHTARISAMGTMASTLAHELNQPITAVATFVSGVRNLLGDYEHAERPLVDEGTRRRLRRGAPRRRHRAKAA